MKCSKEDLERYVAIVITEDQRENRLKDVDDARLELEIMAAVDYDAMPCGIQPEDFLKAWNEFMDKREAGQK